MDNNFEKKGADRMNDQQPKLNKALGMFEAISIAVSDISPTTGVFLMIPVVLTLTGTASFTVVLIAGLIALSVAFTMAELGSMFPNSGGIYSVIRHVCGRPVGFVALVAYLGEGIFIPSVVALGSASYICNIFPSLNVNWVGLVIILLATGVAILNIASSAKFTAFLLALEILVVGVFTVAAFIHVHQSPSVLLTRTALDSNHNFTAVSWAQIFTAVTVMLLSFNGYDSAINISEETAGDARNVGKTVSRSALVGFLAQFIPLVAMILAAPEIKTLLSSSTPVSYIGQESLGGSAAIILNVGAAVAMFACTIAVILQFSRVLYSSGRDNAWPKAISRGFATLHSKLLTPWISSVVLGVIGAVFCFFSNIGNLISFTSVLVVCLYATIAVSWFIVKSKTPKAEKPYRNPIGIIAPIVAIVGSVAALTQQAHKDLITVACIVVVAYLYYVLYLRRRSDGNLSISESIGIAKTE